MLDAKARAIPAQDDRGETTGAEGADRRYLALVLTKKLVLSVVLMVVAYEGLSLFAYFPPWWVKSFVFLVVFLSMRFMRLSVFLTMGAIAIPLLYQSMPLGMLYLGGCALFLLMFWWFEFFPEAFLLVASTPLWATLELKGIPLPMYFLPIFIAGVWARGAFASLIPGLACFVACVTGVVVGCNNVGPVLVGAVPHYHFYAHLLAPPTAQVPNFFDFTWLGDRVSHSLSETWQIGDYLKALAMSFGHFPFMLIQIGIWLIAGYFVGKLISFRAPVYDLAAAGVGVVAAIGSPIAIRVLFAQNTGEFHVSWGAYVLPAVLAFAMAQLERALRDEQEVAERAYEKALEAHAEAEYQKALAIYNAQVAQARAEALAHGEVWEEDHAPPPPPPPPPKQKALSLDNLNLADTVKLQVTLDELMKKKFAQECSVIDVDVAGSVKLKEGAKPETILYSFGQFHNYMDQAMEKYGGRLMDRAGDGIIYSFHGPGNADNALAAARFALRHLEEFNRSRNKLDKDFVVRVGINTGMIIKDEMTEKGMFFSKVIDIAGHLQKGAQPNSLLLSQDTFDRLEDRQGVIEIGKLAKDNITAYTVQ